jgi:hypothetical protein
VPKPTRVICHACRAQLGSVLCDQLVVWGHEVRYGPRGALTIVCSHCQAERRWTERRAS